MSAQLKGFFPNLLVFLPLLDFFRGDRIEHRRTNLLYRLYFRMRRQTPSRRIGLLPLFAGRPAVKQPCGIGMGSVLRQGIRGYRSDAFAEHVPKRGAFFDPRWIMRSEEHTS